MVPGWASTIAAHVLKPGTTRDEYNIANGKGRFNVIGMVQKFSGPFRVMNAYLDWQRH